MTRSAFWKTLFGSVLVMFDYSALAQQSFPSALNVNPQGAIVAFVNADRVISAIMANGSDKAAAIREGNATIVKLARARQIQLVVQEAVYVDSSIDITEDLIAAAQNRQSAGAQQRVARIAFINTKLISNQGLLPGESSQSFLQRANAVVSNIAVKYDIHLVLQEAVYASPNIDLSFATLAILNGNSDVSGQLSLLTDVSATRVGFVNAYRLMKATGRWYQSISDQLSKINDAVRRVAERKGIHIVLQEGVFADTSLDITTDVLAESDK